MLLKNSKGMTARAFTLVVTKTTGTRYVVLASFIGALTEVKAIWATLVSPRSKIRTLPGYRHYATHPDLYYRTIKTRIARGIHHWTLYPEPGPDSPFLLLLDHDQGKSLTSGLTDLLNTHTLWPVLPHWGDLLWQRGIQ